ncbi:unnamed protein product [marine sediment metagenome]|uniref:Uncharacterized protein n=1 Tax=marine sediment metagenome TaxID=412755 RepID=X0U9S2_9ZZZZ
MPQKLSSVIFSESVIVSSPVSSETSEIFGTDLPTYRRVS